MNAKEITKGIFWAVLQLLGLCVLVWLLYQLKTLLIYMLIAGVVSLIGRPINHFLMKRLKMRAVLATSISIVLLLGILISLFSLFVPLLVQQGENLSLLDVDLLKVNIETLVEEITVYFQLDNSFWEQQFSVDNLFQNVNFGLLPELLNQTLELLGGFTIGLFSVVFILFFFLKDSHLQERIILALVNDKVSTRVEKSIDKTKGLLSRYFLGLLLQISILLLIYSVVLMVFDVENAFIIAFLCALLNLIPYLGPIIGAVLMTLLTMSSFIGEDFSTVILPKTIYVMIGFLVGQLVDNFFSQPFIFSSSVKSHPLEIFIVILASGTLLGPVGMIIAIPLYTTLKVIAQEFLAENKIVKSLTKNF
jgi:predicted PurR-regulated permease PerM